VRQASARERNRLAGADIDAMKVAADAPAYRGIPPRRRARSRRDEEKWI